MLEAATRLRITSPAVAEARPARPAAGRAVHPAAGAVQPTDACAATAAGLSTATMSSSEYRMV
ncbi:hypothetical protein, partial [Mycobacterium avium]|uniref:hypothetical protein n=1 Tax=Mycobacterium avium TaxID=1764 RepID=UPI00191C8282